MSKQTAICTDCADIIARCRRAATAQYPDYRLPPVALVMATCRDCGIQPVLNLTTEPILTKEEADHG